MEQRTNTEGEISLIEIIDILWRGKTIIIIGTIICMLLAALVSWFVLSPEYEAEAYIRVSGETDVPALVKTLHSDITLNEAITDLNLEGYTINNLRGMVNINNEQDSNVIEIKVSGGDPLHITQIANYLTYHFAEKIQTTDISSNILETNKLIEAIDPQIVTLQTEMDEAKQQLDEINSVLTKKNTSLTMNPQLDEIIGTNLSDSDEIILSEEVMNPVYEQLMSRVSQSQIQLNKLAEEKTFYEQKITNYEAEIAELQSQNVREKLQSLAVEKILTDDNAIYISQAIQPMEPIGPRKVLNLTIGMVVGGMLSVIVVFLREYIGNARSNKGVQGKSGVGI
ncbi:Wzz/FepE/Etk N-terminal domain-containing protein [Longirhabdus pacifica]|uniref:Wzz/FepE/Etk N-terminal domain-containing protein n=1 Tax=Longirhabdus pacifica TaxID=2305227 RepID=UPI001008DB5D|nr:Wzz/FepE/Etk N-terminal domain-containing protein [Longirhabdus pacifica]